MTGLLQSPYRDRMNLGEELDWRPRRLVTPGPWAGHIPFAFWLIKASRPKILVELGTHSGNSFSAFCQAIRDLASPTRAYAVDTWQGDEHAGYYGDDVFNELKAFLQTDYADFATMVRSTFDDAIDTFSDGAIDILHIDGMHTYDAVKHDFVSWRQKLSPRAVVLFHDINVREREFGVWRLWQELSSEYPAFEFNHSNGLGVLGVGQELPDAIAALFEAGRDPDVVHAVRSAFSSRGRLFELETDILALQANMRGATANIRELTTYVKDLEGANDQLHRQLGSALNDAREEHVKEVEALNERYNHDIEEWRRHRAELAHAIDEIHRSTSWRVTKPLRLSKTAYDRYIRKNVGRVVRRLKQRRAAAQGGGTMPAAPTIVNDALRDVTKSLMMQRFEAFLTSGSLLKLPVAEDCDVSIILVLYNQAEMTYSCLASIKECLAGSVLKVETIIFDNGSKDRTHMLLDRLEGARIIRSDSNLHFLKGVNAASRHARGRHILLLNNDAQLLPGSLESAVKTLDDDPSIGAVGGRLILPDGALQEAGSIIWQDGTCLGYGRGRRPSDPEFMFQRDVDYCSGAFLLTPRALFESMNRLDEKYAPAYYEETDYCVRIWESGRRLVYNPKVTIQHFEFASSGAVKEALELQQRNHQVFCRTHADWLSKQPAAGSDILVARTHHDDSPRILLLEDRIPKVWLGAGYPRAVDVIHGLVALDAKITLFPMVFPENDWVEIWKSLPLTVELGRVDDSIDLREFLRQRRGAFDAIFVTRPHNMRQLRKVIDREPELLGNAKLIYDAEALFSNREILKESLNGGALSQSEQQKLIREELDLTKGSDLVLSVSTAEKEVMVSNGLSNVEILGHKVIADVTTTPFEARRDLVFLGAVHDDNSPNADSIRWFATEVLPELRRLLGQDIRLTVVGLVKAPSIEALDGSALTLLGTVDDLKPIFETARLVVVPTRFAAGIPHKVHQVASFGVPVVATDLIATQLGWSGGKDILASSEPMVFAAHCHQLYTNSALWEEIRRNALSRLGEDCSPEKFDATIRGLVELAKSGRKSVAKSQAPVAPAYVGRKLEEDFAITVPLGFKAAPKVPPSIAAVVHIFYPELAPEILSYLQNLPEGSDVFVSTDTEAKKAQIAGIFADYGGGQVEIRVFENRGRDIAPKIVGFRDIYDRYDYVLHLHSKMSKHNEKLNDWRIFLYESLAGSREIVDNILYVLSENANVGMIFPQHFEYIRQWITWTDNFTSASRLASRIGVDLRREQALDFPSGSMFWARSAALKPLLDLELSFADFPPEGGQEDNTIAHAIERLYAIICEKSGYDWIKIARPEFYFRKGQMVRVDNEDALAAFLRDHLVKLTDVEILEKNPAFHETEAYVTPELRKLVKRQAEIA